MSGVAAILQERDRILVQLDDSEELTLDEVEVLVRLRLRTRDFDKALTVMESRSLYERGWAADTEDLRGFIRASIGGNLPDRIVDIAFRDAELAAGNDGTVDADGLKVAAGILVTAQAVAGRPSGLKGSTGLWRRSGSPTGATPCSWHSSMRKV